MAESLHPRAEVFVATTWECNLRCSYCFVQRNWLSKSADHMSADLANRVVDAIDEALPEVETICIHFYGGEPLLNLPAMRVILECSAKKRRGRFSFAITTNGTLCSKTIMDMLQAGSFKVVLSIDGPTEIHDACRRTAEGTPSHARVMRFLQTLRLQTNCEVRGSAVVRSGWGLQRATEYLRNLPVDVIKAQAVRGSDGTPYALSEREGDAYLEDLEVLGSQVIDELEAGQIPRDDRFSSRILQLLKGEERQAFCGAGYTTFGITPTGDVLPCILINPKGNILGHVKDDPKSWKEAGYRWKVSRPLRSECEVCSYFYLCGGGCPALIPVCGSKECDIIRKNCDVALSIYEHFHSTPEVLLGLAGIF